MCDPRWSSECEAAPTDAMIVRGSIQPNTIIGTNAMYKPLLATTHHASRKAVIALAPDARRAVVHICSTVGIIAQVLRCVQHWQSDPFMRQSIRKVRKCVAVSQNPQDPQIVMVMVVVMVMAMVN